MSMGDADLGISTCPFGRPIRDAHFLFAPTYTPLNHGSFGTYPKSVQKRLHECQALSEARPDNFQRYQYPPMLDESRAAMAQFLGLPVDEVVFVPNATTAINVVLRSLRYEKRDVILHLSTVYGAVEKTIRYLCETTEVDDINVAVQYPIDDELLVSLFRGAIQSVKSQGKTVKVAVFDTISSLPGVRVPWERLVEVCKVEGVLSMVDGAHGVGHIGLGLAKVQPDFFASNCHKWLYVPRGCAVFHVPKRNQHLIRTSLPTSHGFDPLPREGGKEIVNPLMISGTGKSNFVMLFEFVATLDVSPYLCIEEALKFRKDVCGGEEEIMTYCERLSNEGGAKIAEILGTEIMENGEKSLARCALTNVKLPLVIGDGPGEIDVYLPAFIHADAFWARLSGQIYLELEDCIRGARILRDLCERARGGEYLKDQKRE